MTNLANLFTTSFCKFESEICGYISVDSCMIDNFIKSKNSDKITNIIITLDVSGSMDSNLITSTNVDDITDSKLEIVKKSLTEVFEYLFVLGENGHNIYVTLITFSSETDIIFEEKITLESRQKILNCINSLEALDDTNILSAILKSKEYFDNMIKKHENSESFAIFITDGMNTKVADNLIILNELTNYTYIKHFVGVGVGRIGDDYDGNLLNSMFNERFFGCPTTEEMTNVIIENIFSASSSVIKLAKITFANNVINDYDISTIIKKSDIIEEYCLDKITIATKIPILLIKKNNKIIKDDQIFVKIEGTYFDNTKIDVELNLLDNLNTSIVSAKFECDIFKTYFEFRNVCENFEKSNIESYKLAIKSALINVTQQSKKISETHVFYPIYKTLLDKLTAVDFELGSVHLKNLTDSEFKDFLKLGNMKLFSQSNCVRQLSSSSRSFARQLSTRYNSNNLTCSTNAEILETTKTLKNIPIKRMNSMSHRSHQSCQSPKTLEPILRRQLSIPLDEFTEDFTIELAEELLTVDKIICLICCKNEVNIVCYPCSHANLCTECIRLTNNTCPMCRKKIEFVAEISINGNKCDTVGCYNLSNVINLPCRHVNKCQKCCIAVNSCELCNQTIEKKIKVFKNGY